MTQGYARKGLASTLAGPAIIPWSRPSDWLALPSLTTSDHKIVGLHAVRLANNFVAFTMSGAYTVDWGDGTASENFAAGVTAYRNLAWGSYSASTLTNLGYRQAIITITPQASSNLTSANFYVKHNQAGLPNGYTTGWLDMTVACPLLQVLQLGINTVTTMVNAMLEQITIVGSPPITGPVNMFGQCYKLAKVVGTAWSANLVDVTNMFANCYALQSVPLLNTSAVTTFVNMFASCYSLQSVPVLNTALGTNFTGMFNGCVALKAVPLINTALGTNFTSMLQSCNQITTIPLLNTAAGTTFSSMFQSCVNLQTIPLLNTAAGGNFTAMFLSCVSLTTIPLLNTAAGTIFTNMFQSCTSLAVMPLLNVANGTSFGNMFISCVSLQVGALSGTRFSISYSACSLSAAELDNIYNNLGTASGGTQTITVSSNFGTSADTPSIATAKGWTVAGT